jgi:hypothetical protein
VEYGHDLYKIKNDYTIDQVYLFYDKCRKLYYDEKKLDAYIALQSAVYAAPAYSKSDVSKKKRNWENFIKTLDYGSIVGKSNKTVGNLKSLFSKLGVRIKTPEQGGK